jgi:hypothetical protein
MNNSKLWYKIVMQNGRIRQRGHGELGDSVATASSEMARPRQAQRMTFSLRPQLCNLAPLPFCLLQNSLCRGYGLTSGVYDMPHQQIRSSTDFGDLQWTSNAYSVTVNYVLLCTMITMSKRLKFNDLPCILLLATGMAGADYFDFYLPHLYDTY